MIHYYDEQLGLYFGHDLDLADPAWWRGLFEQADREQLDLGRGLEALHTLKLESEIRLAEGILDIGDMEEVTLW